MPGGIRWIISLGPGTGPRHGVPPDYGFVRRRSVVSGFVFDAAGISLSRETILCASLNDRKTSSMTSHYLSSFQDHLCHFYPNAAPHTCLLGSRALYVVLGSGRERPGGTGTLSRPGEERETFLFSQPVIFSGHAPFDDRSEISSGHSLSPPKSILISYYVTTPLTKCLLRATYG